MTLGEKISSLRNGEGMSQGDLAEKLNVSRQSVSKWETNASIPDIDKLIQLSNLFNLTLDELVRGEELYSKAKEASESNTTDSQTQIIIQKNISTQKMVGFILLGFGLMCCLLALFFGRGLLAVGGYLVLCSVLCLVLKKERCAHNWLDYSYNCLLCYAIHCGIKDTWGILTVIFYSRI